MTTGQWVITAIGIWLLAAILLGPFIGRFLRGPRNKEGDKR